VLCNLLTQHGPGLADDARLLEALLRDFCGEYKREIAAMLNAQRALIPSALRISHGVPVVLLLTRLTQQLRSQQGLEELVARWAVESWALALGVAAPGDCTTPEALWQPRAGKAAPRPKISSPAAAKQYETWKRDLFDFSRRNPLLYYKPTQSSALEILNPNSDELFDQVAVKGKTLSFPQYRVEPVLPEPGSPPGTRYRYTYTLLRKGQLECDKQEGALIRALGNIRTLARASRTELGLNSLYLGFGLLKWTELGATTVNSAPILMIPADIEVKDGRDRFVLTFFDDDIVLNPTLAAFLADARLGYNLELPEYQEDQNIPVGDYLREIETRVAGRQWQVEPRVILRLFSFQTIRMGKDMDQARAINLYPVTIRLLAHEAGAVPGTPPPALPQDLDQQLHPEEFFQVLEADASQVEALVAARSGAALVLHGPPGTGKSQTIVNLIAQAIADRKTVLFVSQKKAALDVVYRRLTQLGLDKFCLQAHSDKANKRAILNELQLVYHNARKAIAPIQPQDYLTLYTQRNRLNGVARELNTPQGELGWTIQSVQGHLIQAKDVPNVRSLIGLLPNQTALEVGAAQWLAIQDAARAWVDASRALGCAPEAHPWRHLVYQTPQVVASEFQLELEALLQTLDQIARFGAEIPPRLGLPAGDCLPHLAWFLRVAKILQDAPVMMQGWFGEEKEPNPPAPFPQGKGEPKGIPTSEAKAAEINLPSAPPFLSGKGAGGLGSSPSPREIFAEAQHLATTILSGRQKLRQQLISASIEKLDHAATIQGFQHHLTALNHGLSRPYEAAQSNQRSELNKALAETKAALEDALRLLEHVTTRFGFNFALSLAQMDWLSGLGRLCSNDPRPQPGWFNLSELARLRNWLQTDVVKAAGQYTQARARVQTQWSDDVLGLDVNWLSDYLEVKHKSQVERLFSGEFRTWSNGMARFWRATKKVGYEDFVFLLHDLKQIRASLAWLKASEPALQKNLGPRYQGPYSNFDAILKAIAQTEAIVQHYRGQPVPPAFQKSLCEGAFKSSEWTQFATQFGQSATRLRLAVQNLMPLLNWPEFVKKAGQGDNLLVKPALAAVHELIATFDQTNLLYDGLLPHFQATPPGFVGLLDALKTASEIVAAETRFTVQTGAFQTAFASYFSGLQTDWAALGQALDVAEELDRTLLDPSAPPGLDRTAALARYTYPANASALARSFFQSGSVLEKTYTQQITELEAHFASPDDRFASPPVGVDLRVDPGHAHNDPGSVHNGDPGNAHNAPGNTHSRNPDHTHNAPGRTHRCAPTPADASFGLPRDWLNELLANIDQLPAWQQFADAAQEAQAQGLENLCAEVLQSQPAAVPQLAEIVHKRFCQTWLSEAGLHLPLAGNLKIVQHKQQIQAFQKLDQKLMHTQREKVLLAWQSNLPAVSNAVPDSQAGILSREFQKKRAHLPLRRLFARIPDLFLKLKPCVLMSPLSVAAYLDLDAFQECFDMVIFDEASQVKPAFAIGAILRGKQVIVAGDTKQLPPTDFFRVTGDLEEYLEDETSEEDNPAIAEPLESILGEFIGLPGVRQATLLWHYRSRHEALIQFSNAAYYHNDLITFPGPSVDSARAAIRFVETAGAYDRGKTRQNVAEARRVVELIREHCATYGAKHSLGVITLSTAQEDAIREELKHALDQADSGLPADFLNEDAAGDEPFFIKSLERVQGDERDTILLSVGYGPDAAGKITQNFGPINMDGGERRLNVAITRARRELIVIASLAPGDIRLTDKSKPGLIDLKRFLEYCQGIGAPRHAQPTPSPDAPPFESAIRQAIQGMGYTVDQNVGLGQYQIGLAVRNPAKPDEYGVAIESDGPTYAAVGVARDREWLRPHILTGMGWKRVLRLWSREWLEQPQQAAQNLKTALHEAHLERVEPLAAEPVRAEAIEPAAEPEPTPPTLPEVVDWQSQLSVAEYRCYQAPRQYSLLSGRPKIDLIKEIVQFEQPIHRELLLERWAGCFASDVSEYRKKKAFAQYLERSISAQRVVLEDDFARLPGASGAIMPRLPGEAVPPRKIEHIARAEIAALAYQILSHVYGISRTALVRKTSELLGYKTLTPIRQERIDAAIGLLVERGNVTVNGDAVLPNPNGS
jgi:hypothetical protein